MGNNKDRAMVPVSPEIQEYAAHRLETNKTPLSATYRDLLQKGYDITTSDDVIPEKINTRSGKRPMEPTDEMWNFAEQEAHGVDADIESMMRAIFYEGMAKRKNDRTTDNMIQNAVREQRVAAVIPPVTNNRTAPALPEGKPSLIQKILRRNA